MQQARIEELKKIFDEMQLNIPGFLGAGIAELQEGFPVIGFSQLPDFDLETTGPVYAWLAKSIKRIASFIGEEVTGNLETFMIRMDAIILFSWLIKDSYIMVVAAKTKEANIGFTRTIVRKFMPRLEELLI